jgi:hypothetical protein
MASKRQVRRRKCGTKRRFDTERAARAGMISAIARGVSTKGYASPYRCKFCGKYHWGHSRPFDNSNIR